MGRNYVICVKSGKDGNTYCYDAERRKWVIISEEDVNVAQIPGDVLATVIEAASGGACDKGEGRP